MESLRERWIVVRPLNHVKSAIVGGMAIHRLDKLSVFQRCFSDESVAWQVLY